VGALGFKLHARSSSRRQTPRPTSCCALENFLRHAAHHGEPHDAALLATGPHSVVTILPTQVLSPRVPGPPAHPPHIARLASGWRIEHG
jgi:hypothetical protein